MEDPELEVRLDYSRIQRGFYHEGRLGVRLPSPYDVVYVSGEYSPGFQPEARERRRCILGKKFNHTLAISPDEAGSFYKISQQNLDGLLSSQGIPEGFVDWIHEMQGSG
jgi:hypothetical protein